MELNNPFLITGYNSPKYFCDREMETDTILDALHNGRNLTLIAPRRMGKTGLIQHTFYKLREQESDIVTLYMDIYPTQSLGDFVRLFANTVLGKLDSAPQKAMNRISKFIKSCHPLLTFDQLTGAPQVTIDLSPAKEENTLKEIFEYLASSDKRCYIAIDEFQQINEYPEKGVEALLRSYMQFLPNVNFVFAGSKQHMMEDMFASANRPFYQSTQLLNISSIDKDKYAHFAMNFFARQNMTLPETVFNSIYDRFEGHTWYIQNILNRLYSYKKNVDMDLVDYAINQIISESSSVYAHLLKAYSPGQVRLTKAIAKEGCIKEILSGEFISRHNLRAASSVQSSLEKLLRNELVYLSDDGYIIYDRFMGQWLQNQPF